MKTILPYTEASPVALLGYTLAGYANMVGHNAHWRMERTKHYLNLFICMVGDTSRGRKGTSRSTPDYMFEQIDRDWRHHRIMSGLSSGQGLIWQVRDPVVKDNGDESEVIDTGSPDKRLFVVQEEFAQVLKLAPTDGNILSATIRDAWDSGNLRTMVSGRKLAPVVASDAHITIIGHVTKLELLRYMDSTEQANGFGNRFLWMIVERSKKIPNPKGTPEDILRPLIEQLAEAVTFGVRTGELSRAEDAEEVWTAAYDKLTDDRAGMTAAMTARAAPQVMRLASIYALLDKSTTIRVQHLMAALALWDYCEASTRMIFGESLGDPIADKILTAVRQSTEGLSRTEIRDLFSRHNSEAIDAALDYLVRAGLVEEIPQQTAGRPRTVYVAKRMQ